MANLGVPTSYELPMSRDYVAHWKVRDALRELIQNALDSGLPYSHEISGGNFSLRTEGAELSPSSLVLGVTSKANDPAKIGSFGEGYKLALLVLTRSNKIWRILNKTELWTGEFRQSPKYGAEILVINSTPLYVPRPYLEFQIQDLTEEELDQLRRVWLGFNPDPDAIETPFGQILPNKRGSLYVGGLWICDTPLTYGYNVNPQHITLERDRQTVSHWDLKELTRDMWFSTSDPAFVAELIRDDVPDVEYVRYGTEEHIKKACFKLFREKHPESIAVKSQEELERRIASGLTNTVYVNPGYYNALVNEPEYLKFERVAAASALAKMPEQILLQFRSDYTKRFSKAMLVDFDEIIVRSKAWHLR